MTIDMRQFHAVFFEESMDHISDMESLLMELDPSAPNDEDINSIFRAAHSMKGGSGIFGFDAIGSITHVMESLLDKARQHELSLNPELIDLLLKTTDALSEILECYRSESDIDWDKVNRVTTELETTLSRYSGESQPKGYGFFQDPKLEAHSEQAYGFFEQGPENQSKSDDEGFGFFEEDEQPSSDEAFGFFDEEDLNSSKTEDQGFGFFEDSIEQDDSYGFFDETESPAPTASAPAETTEPPSPEAKGTEQVPEDSPEKKPIQASTTKKSGSGSAKNASAEAVSIRVDVQKVDQLINLVGELVITQSMLNLLGSEVGDQIAEKFQNISAELDRHTREIQEAVMSIRMLPISFVFNRFPRVVRDLAGKLNKKINLTIEGGETELDKGLTEKLVDPLTHLVRNSLDHGIEDKATRRERGKSDTGNLVLSASQQGGNIIIRVSDDGGGLNKEKILEKARQNNIQVSDSPSDDEVWQLIFAPGFSTAKEVTDVSGRGVGMDVVRKNIHALGGRIEIESKPLIGSTFTIVLPLTLAIVDGMSVAVGDQTFVIPLVHIVESMQPASKDIKLMGQQDRLLWVRGQYWPLLSLHSLMNITPRVTEPSKGIVVLIDTGRYKFALLVDDLVGQQQVVIKSLERHYRRVPGIAGATIMGDGSVALILDAESVGRTLRHAEMEVIQ